MITRSLVTAAALASLAMLAPVARAHTFSVSAPYPSGAASSEPVPGQATSDPDTGRLALRLESSCTADCVSQRQRGSASVMFNGRLDPHETRGTVRAVVRIRGAATRAGLPATPGTHTLNAAAYVISGATLVAGCNEILIGGLFDPPTIEQQTIEVACPFERPAGVRGLLFGFSLAGSVPGDPGELAKLTADAVVERITVEL